MAQPGQTDWKMAAACQPGAAAPVPAGARRYSRPMRCLLCISSGLPDLAFLTAERNVSVSDVNVDFRWKRRSTVDSTTTRTMNQRGCCVHQTTEGRNGYGNNGTPEAA